MGRYQETMKRLGHTRGFAEVFKRTLPHIDRAVSRVTRGKYTFGETVVPTLILVHKGRKSGRELRTPLSYVTVGDGFALAASNWGQPHHPAWSHNLSVNNEAQVVVDGQTIDVRARRAGSEEKAELWKRLVAIWPAYDTYLTRSGRDIRVFVLERRIAV
jgi:deazaflavin-dependent oxidoreductase (nitroreductase family)